MTTSAQRPASPRRSRSAPTLQIALGLGIAVYLLVLLPAFALGAWGLLQFSRKPAAAPVAVAAAVAPTVEPPVADAPAADEEPEPIAPPVPDQKQQPELIAAPRAAPAKAPVRPRKTLSEEELRLQLVTAPEFGLTQQARDALAAAYKKEYQTNTAMHQRAEFDPSILLEQFPRAAQLPIRPAHMCQLSPHEAATLGVLSRKLHAYLETIAPKDEKGKRDVRNLLRDVLQRERRGKRPEWLRAEALPAMVQILIAEDVPLRLLLVDLMSEIDGKAASVRLAQRAVFDLSPEVRKAAIDALRDRPRSESRQVFVDALRYPWPHAADHAADALAALEDSDAAPMLVALLGKPDPTVPFATRTGAAAREIVRVNHIGNCLLCHAPAVGRDPVTDVDPFANRPQQTFQAGNYGTKLPGSSGGVWANKVLIRADVQFVRQDFSVRFPVTHTFSAVQGLRFDYLIRTRPLKGAELQEWKKRKPPLEPESYPQRDAVLYALRAVTGQDPGPTTDAWVQLYPHANAEAEGRRLAAALRRAPPEQRDQLLASYRDAKAEHYTDGLANAIPHVKGAFQAKIRAALVERLARLPADLLRARMQEDNEELCRAAALACIRKLDPDMLPDLIGLLLDPDAELADGAHHALKRATGEDFGPGVDAGPEDRHAAAAKWQAWHRERAR